MDSSAPTAFVESEIVNDNWVAAESEIITETPTKGEAWIQKCSQPLLSQKMSRKTESVSTGKSSMKQLPKVTHGFVSAPNPCWLRKCRWKLCHYHFWNRQRNWFRRWRVDSLAPTAFVESEIVNDNWVAAESEIITETPSKGDAWIQKRSHPC